MPLERVIGSRRAGVVPLERAVPLLSQELQLCLVVLHLQHLMTIPTPDIFVAFGFLCDSLVLYVLGLPSILMYPGVKDRSRRPEGG